MQIITDISQVELAGPTFLTIGNFDGLHRGHQALIRELRQQADMLVKNSPNSRIDAGRTNVGLLTFDPHPLSVLRPDFPLSLLTTPKERLTLAAAAGADFGILHPFTRRTADLRARDFMPMLKNNLGLHTLVVGPDFALGKGRAGHIDRLRELGQTLDYHVVVMDSVDWQDKSVRSSRIRTLLQNGEVGEAAALLGRPYHATGLVVLGDQRGRQIGSPTANLQTSLDKLLPLDGVYATRTHIFDDVVGESADVVAIQTRPSASVDSVTNLGVRPTVNGREHRFETHLLDFPLAGESGDLYGKNLKVEFIERLRGEERFEGIESLIAQIQQDIVHARTIFARTNSQTQR